MKPVLSCLVVLLFLGPAQAAEPGLDDAISLYRDGELEQAQRALERIAKKVREPREAGRVHLYLGVIAAVKGQGARVDALFEKALRGDPTLRLDPTQFKAELIQRFEAVRGKLRGKLKVTATLAGASVWLDGRRAGIAPLELQLPTGVHELEVRRADGGDRTQLKVVVPVDGEVAARAELRPPAPAVSLPAPPPVSPPPPPPRPRRIWTWVAAGAALAVGGAALGLGLSAKSSYDEFRELDAKRDPALSGQLDDLDGTIKGRATGANVCVGVAAAAAVTSVVLFFVEGRQPASERVAISARGAAIAF
jgi:hypothetical protein